MWLLAESSRIQTRGQSCGGVLQGQLSGFNPSDPLFPLLENKVGVRGIQMGTEVPKRRSAGLCSVTTFLFFFFCLLSFVVVVAISWAAPTAYGGSQARGPIGAVATGLCQSHSNAGSELRLQPTPQLTATPDR